MPTRVLIIDDDISFAKMAEIRLRTWRPDVEFTFAHTLGDAQTILANAADLFTLVLLDQHLPDGLGTEILAHPRLEQSAVLAMSSDSDPIVPANAVRAGAGHFLAKVQLREHLFIPLIEALIEQKRIQQELIAAKLRESRMNTIQRLIATLRHEINNPLGAVLGGAYLLRNRPSAVTENETIRLIESSGERIGHVLKELCRAAELDELEEVTKAQEQLFQIPGDPKWDEK